MTAVAFTHRELLIHRNKVVLRPMKNYTESDTKLI